MTVKELIEKLQKLDQDKSVRFFCYDTSDVWDDYSTVDNVVDKEDFVGLF